MSEYRLTKALLTPINTTGIILLGVYTFIWGFWIANPWWDAFSRAPLYAKLDEFGTEYFWGGLAMLCALVISYGALRPSYHALVTGSAVGFLHWGVISIFYFWGDWENTGGITALTFATYSAFIYLNVRVNKLSGKKELKDILN